MMLKPIRSESSRIADGRRIGVRTTVLTSLSSISCYVFARKVIPVVDTEERKETIYPGAEVLSSQEEHATEYEDKGYAKLLFDHYSSGSMYSDMSDITIGDPTFYALVEPFDIADIDSTRQMIRNIPDWQPSKGDIFALVVNGSILKWLECLGGGGQSLHSDHGVKYAFNVRDELSHLEPFITIADTLKPDGP